MIYIFSKTCVMSIMKEQKFNGTITNINLIQDMPCWLAPNSGVPSSGTSSHELVGYLHEVSVCVDSRRVCCIVTRLEDEYKYRYWA